LSVGDGFPAGRSLSANDGTSAYGNITTISESPKARGTIYVGTDDGNVQMTTDGGAHWTDLTPRFPPAATHYVSKVYASRHDARTAYVAFDGHWDDDTKPYLFKTTDGGATWAPIVSGIPNWKPVLTIEEDPKNSNALFVGTEFGLYWSFDGGARWLPATGNVPPVQIDRIIVDAKTNDLILATHGRGVIILDDIAPLEAGPESAGNAGVHLLPLRSAVEVQRYRDIPWPGGNAFVARNAAVGTAVSYTVSSESRSPGDSVRIDVKNARGEVVATMAGSDERGMHRVPWDMRYQFVYVPPPSDSGFYGPPHAPYVPPGEYSVVLAARGTTQIQKVLIRADSRGASTPDGQREREAIDLRARDVSRVYHDAVTAMNAIDAELAAIGAPTDSVKAIAAEVATLRQRARGNSIVSGIGRLFDLTAAIESSSMPPTDTQRRSIDASVAEFADITAKVNDIISKRLPAMRAAAGRPQGLAIPLVRPP
jgi:hypothetical protein